MGVISRVLIHGDCGVVSGFFFNLINSDMTATNSENAGDTGCECSTSAVRGLKWINLLAIQGFSSNVKTKVSLI